MKRSALILIVLVSFAGRGFSQTSVSLRDGRLSLEIPGGFTGWTAEQISLKYPNANPPQFVFANSRGNVSIAITFSQTVVSLDQLPQLKTSMEQMLPRMIPGLEWIARETLEINGRPWIHFELTSFAVDADIHNHMYMTSFDGRMLGINMNSTAGEYAEARNALIRSRDSIRVFE